MTGGFSSSVVRPRHLLLTVRSCSSVAESSLSYGHFFTDERSPGGPAESASSRLIISSSGEERKPSNQEELKKLCAQVELLSKDGAKARRRKESRREEKVGRKMEIEEETDCQKKLDGRKKHLQRLLRDIEKVTDMEPVLRDRQKESWIEELQEIERKRRITRRCRISPRNWRVCRTIGRSTSKTLVTVKKKCESSMKMSGKSGNCRKEADILEEEIQPLQAGEQRRASCASQSNGYCFDPAMVPWQMEQVFACGAAQTQHFIQVMQEEFYRRFKAAAAPEQMAGGEKEEWEGDWDKEKAANDWYESATVSGSCCGSNVVSECNLEKGIRTPRNGKRLYFLAG